MTGTGGQDPRVTRSKLAVIEATRSLLREAGFSGVTIEGVALRSGVAKSTIYRHWEDRNRLLIDAFGFEEKMDPAPLTDDLHADLRVALRVLTDALTKDDWVALMPPLLEAAERDHDFRRISRPFLESRRRPITDRLKQAVKRGELPASTNVDLVLSMLTGPLFYRRLFIHKPITETFVDKLLTNVLRGTINE